MYELFISAILHEIFLHISMDNKLESETADKGWQLQSC